ncbi:hypothetical protein BG015_011762 [Linnemannia schmuckeri]|uniref:Uncharacterized protein n=1 Tax=Linnemannia schmuckeri TaxID=64567 RepID=A0A9P5V854_9FUNG|nr:hypothetical protein BG015_011762 [Linnemannia schmuckeri]
MGKKNNHKKPNTSTTTTNIGTHNTSNNARSKKVKLMVKNPFTDMATFDSTKEQHQQQQQQGESTIIQATAPLTAAELPASQSSQPLQRRPKNYNPFSDSCANLSDQQGGEDEGDNEDEDEDEESVVWARREALAALDPYNVNAHKEHFKSLKPPKQQKDMLEQTVLPSLPSSPSAETSTQAKDFEEPEGSEAMIVVSTPPMSHRQQQQQRDSFRSNIYSTPKAQIHQRPISRDRTHTTNTIQEDIVPEISISLATPSPPPSSYSSKRHHRRESSLANANPALLTTTFTPSPLSLIACPLDEEFDRLEASNKKGKSNRSTAIYTNLFQRISSFGSLGGKTTTDGEDEEVMDHIGAEMKDPTAPASKSVSTSWFLKRNTLGTAGVDSSSSLSDHSLQQSTQATRFSILGKKSNKSSRASKKSRKYGIAAVMDSLDPWDSCDDMLLQGTDDEDLYDDKRSPLSATQKDQFLKGRMSSRRRSSDAATTRVETEQGVIPRLGKGAMAGMEDWMTHPRTAAICGDGSFHKVHHNDAVPVPVPSVQHHQGDSVRPVSTSVAEYTTISLASPPMTVYSTQAIGGGTKKSQDQGEDGRMHRMMNGDHDGGDQDFVSDYHTDNNDDDSDFVFNHDRVDQRSSSTTFSPIRKAVSTPPRAAFSSFSSLQDFTHSATGLSRSSTVPIGSSNGTGNISPPSFSPNAYLRRSQTTTVGFGGYSEVQQGYTSSAIAATTGTDGGRASFSPVSRRKNTPVMVPTIVVPKHVPGISASVALSATPMSSSSPPLTSLSNSSTSPSTTTIMTSSDEDSSDFLSMATARRMTLPTRTFQRLGRSSTTPSLTVPAKAATAANSTQLPSSLAAAAMAAAQRARAAYSQASASITSTSTINRSNTSVSVDSMTGPLTGNDYIGQFERARAQTRNFGEDPFGSTYRIHNSSSFSSSDNSSSLNSLATTVNQHQQHHGSTAYHPTAMSSTTTLLVDIDDHEHHTEHTDGGVGGGDIVKVTNRGFGFGLLRRPSSLSFTSNSITDKDTASIRRTRQSSTHSDISEKLMHLPDPSPFEGMCSCRGLVNITSMVLILCGLILLILGYPIASSLKKDRLAAEAAAAEAAEAANAALSQVRFAIDSQQHQQGGLVGPLSKTSSSTVVKTATGMMVDPDTPQDKKTTVAKDGQLWDLVFSDEFDQDGRSFAPGQDPHWEAVNLPPSTAMGTLEHYSSDQVTTKNGQLEITLQRNPALPSSSGFSVHKRDGGSTWKYTSGMLQSWNKMCFQGGILEVAVSLPGSPAKAGLKPRVFVLGNLARYGYPASMDGVWPFSSSSSSSQCSTSTSSNSTASAQRLNGCSSDANTLGRMSRGAPEMSLLETHYGVQMDSAALEAQKQAIQLLQQAPPKAIQQREFYKMAKRQLQQQERDQGVEQGDTVVLQKQSLGSSRCHFRKCAPRQSIAISSVKLSSSSSSTSSGSTNSSTVAVETSTPQWIHPIDTRFFAPSSSSSSSLPLDKDEEFVKIGLEYWPGSLNTTSIGDNGDEDAYIQFSLNNNRNPPLLSNSHSLYHQTSPSTSSPTTSSTGDWYKDAKTLPATTLIPQEPMSIVVGLGLLQDELLLDPELQFPAVMKIDYIRLYQPRQDEGKRQWLSCDPIDHPTAKYIRAHPRAYADPSVNTWADAGYV